MHQHLDVAHALFSGPNEALKSVRATARNHGWRRAGVSAIDERVLWTQLDDHVRLHYRENVKEEAANGGS